MSLFSKNLRFLRKQGNHNQEDISILFKKRGNTIGNWENEKSEPNLKELMVLGSFFKVSTHDLLHLDLESAVDGVNKDSAYGVMDRVNSQVSEASPDAFWVILREIRALNDKVDLLVSSMDSTNSGQRSDKSYH